MGHKTKSIRRKRHFRNSTKNDIDIKVDKNQDLIHESQLSQMNMFDVSQKTSKYECPVVTVKIKVEKSEKNDKNVEV